MYNFSQEQIFMLFFIIGIIIGMCFDFFRVIRKSFKTIDIITFLEDLIFITFSGTLFIYSIIKLNGGEVRFYLFLAIFFGISIYLLTISNLYVIILNIFVKICKKFFKIPYFCIKKVVNNTKTVIKKDF